MEKFRTHLILDYLKARKRCTLIELMKKFNVSSATIHRDVKELSQPAGAATLGQRAAFIGTVGDDADGRMILETFARQGVDTSLVAIRKGATSAIAYLWIDEKTGNRSCGKQGGTAEFIISVLVPPRGNRGFFNFQEGHCGKYWAVL